MRPSSPSDGQAKETQAEIHRYQNNTYGDNLNQSDIMTSSSSDSCQDEEGESTVNRDEDTTQRTLPGTLEIQTPNSESSTRNQSNGSERAQVYARVSTQGQDENGKSLDRQIEVLQDSIAEDDDVVETYEPVTDGGKTGTDFQRPGIKKVFDRAEQGKIDRLYVTKLNRIGRCAPETLYFVYQLQAKMDVTIVVGHDHIDISRNLNDLLMATMSILGGHFSTEKRVTSSIKSQITQFKDDRDWGVFHNYVPVGYEADGDDWIQVADEEVGVVQDLFEHFVREESYTDTAEYISRKYGEDGFDMTRGRISRILRRSLYVGRPSKTLDTDRVDQNEIVVEDPGLQIVDEETFESAQKIIRENKRRYSKSNDTHDPLDFIEIVGIETMLTTFAGLHLHCPDCDSTALRRNGKRRTDDLQVHNYECKACGRQMKWPNKNQLSELREQGYF